MESRPLSDAMEPWPSVMAAATGRRVAGARSSLGCWLVGARRWFSRDPKAIARDAIETFQGSC